MKKSVKRGKQSRPAWNSSAMSVLAPNAPFFYTEAYKTLRTNLEFVCAAGKLKSILITSALPEESKSTVSINLALTLAGNGKSVVLVECDLRKPTMRKYLKLERGALGLSSFLSGTATLSECIRFLPGQGISVITAGTTPPNPSELLSQNQMQALVEELKQHFDYVILDAPPITVVTDAAVVGRMADGALLVIRSKFAPTRMVRMALNRLRAVDIRVLGTVITRYNPKKSGWRSGYNYENYGYGYGQRQNDS